MSANPGQPSSAVALILYKEIVEGDVRKINAESNDADTGGGARDFRFRNFDKLEPIIRQMFPNVTKERRRREGQYVDVDVFKGTFHWIHGGNDQVKAVEFESPTTARPKEGRLTRVHECFDPSQVPPFGAGNRLLLLLVQRTDGTVWPYFVDQNSLSTQGAWDPRVAKELLDCIAARRPQKSVVIGFRDFTTGNRYCNGR